MTIDKKPEHDNDSWWEEFYQSGEPDMEEEESGGRRRPKWLLQLAAAIALIAFMAFSYAWLPLIAPSHFEFLRQDRELSSEDLVKASKPAIVTIKATIPHGIPASLRAGTGFNIDPNGLVVTNRHVVEGAAALEITFADEQRFFAKDYEEIAGYDLAIIRIQGTKLPVLPVANGMPAQGEELTIIGNPLGYKRISARGAVEGYYDGGEAGSTVFAVRATVEPGSSGSPVLNSKGQAIGIVYAITDRIEDGKEIRYSLAIPAGVLEK